MNALSPKSLPIAWVERLFLRFQAIYGNRVATMWGDASPTEVKGVWAEALGPYDGDDLIAGLAATRETHKDFPPTLYQFADLCRDARRRRLAPPLAIPAPLATTEQTDAALAEIKRGSESIGRPKADGQRREWAKRVLERAATGTEPIPLIAIDAAKQALGMA